MEKINKNVIGKTILLFMLLINPCLSENVILDNFENDFNDASFQNRLSAAYSYSIYGSEHIGKYKGVWSVFCDTMGSQILTDNNLSVTKNNIHEMIRNNILHVHLVTSTSKENNPVAGIKNYIGEETDHFNFSNMSAIKIRCKGTGYIRIALGTNEIIEADRKGFYGVNFTLQKDWNTLRITPDMLQPETFSEAYSNKRTWDHGKSRVTSLQITTGYYSDVNLFIDYIEFEGMIYSDFGFNYKETQIPKFNLTLQSNVTHQGIDLIGSGTYSSYYPIFIKAVSSDSCFKFKAWKIVKGASAVKNPLDNENYISISKNTILQANFNYSGPSKGPYSLTLSNNSVTEHEPGAEIGTLTVYNRKNNRTHTFLLNDTRFEIKNGTLKLKDDTSLVFSEGSPISLGITAIDDKNYVIKKNFNIHVKNKNTIDNITYAGFRSSHYGIDPFPTEKEWAKAMKSLSANFPKAKPTGVWVVGRLEANECLLEFPSHKPKSSYQHIRFHSTKQGDRHDPYLTYFDTTGVSVYLQIEPGFADIDTLIDLILSRYSNHPSVIGFGIDLARFQSKEGASNTMIAPTDSQAKSWESKVKSYNTSYTLFLKHWLPNLMPPTYRGDLIFIDDSQGFSELDHMVIKFQGWAAKFPNNTVMFQVGYSIDYHLWKIFKNSPFTLGDAIGKKIAGVNPQQKIGIIWVDYTLQKPEILSLLK